LRESNFHSTAHTPAGSRAKRIETHETNPGASGVGAITDCGFWCSGPDFSASPAAAGEKNRPNREMNREKNELPVK
jgi:hypothetical protein